MHMLYNSDNFVVLRFDVAAEEATPAGGQQAAARGGYEIVDKFARKEIFIEGALAETFKLGVQALVEQTSESSSVTNGEARSSASTEAIQEATQEALDEYIGRFTILAQQPVVLH